ncbi:MAG: nicotinate (nicotinamide) nucleotide adenylyltransferase [Chloroflexi bacterium]|nr:nicotinate (nicotinamide) nucleotide adenylyltransferase [Chloroflexota bacterium]
MRTGIFGGTFDPPHLSHLILAEEAMHQMDLERLLFVLTPDPPHKQDQLITSSAERLLMLEAAIGDNNRFEISRVEIDRPGPHYSVDTVRLLQKELPTAKLIYLMGGDTLGFLPGWSRPEEFIKACYQIGVMRRPDDKIDLAAIELELPGVSEKVQFIEAPLLEIASHQIRRRVAEGRPYRYYVSPAVVEVIKDRGIYRS